jgi:hypothetical protein
MGYLLFNDVDESETVKTNLIKRILMTCERHEAALKIQRWWNDNKWKIYINWDDQGIRK